jgi:hypothetical protein
MTISCFPLFYTYKIRSNSLLSLISIVACDWAPIVVALIFFYHVNLIEVLIMTLANYIVYECGYYINDKFDVSGDHVGRTKLLKSVNGTCFFSIHILIFLLLAILLKVALKETIVINFIFLSVCVLVVMLWHTSRIPKDYKYTRIFSFIFLQLYKYSPIILPLIGINSGVPLMITIFACWGAWRTIAYILVKFSVSHESSNLNIDQNRILHVFSLVTITPIFLAMMVCHKRGELTMVLGIYACISLLRSAFQMTKWKVIWK